MKPLERIWPVVLCMLGVMLAVRCEAGEMVTRRFAPTDEMFANPGQGWLSSSWKPPVQPRLPYSVAYVRYNWEELEPADGAFNWKPLDGVIAAWTNRGRVSFRIMTANAHSRGYYCSPKWLFDAGCKSHDYERGGGDPMAGGTAIKRIEPDYSDPLYLRKHGEFIRALGARYDGQAGVEFVDIGSYGIWGEWHTSNGKPWEIRKQIIDMYLGAFRKTPLVQMSAAAEALAYATAHGTGYRRDGVGSPWHEKTWIGSKKYAAVAEFADQWKQAPVVFEWFGPYDYLKSKSWPFERAVQFMLDNHVTYINDNVGKVPPEDWPQIEKLARLAGYRFVLREISHPAAIGAGEDLSIKMIWGNVGVGKLYRKHTLTLYLLRADHTAAVTRPLSDEHATTWLPGDHSVSGSLQVPSDLPHGEYDLAIALVDPLTKQPAIRFAIDAPQDGRICRISKITVK